MVNHSNDLIKNQSIVMANWTCQQSYNRLDWCILWLKWVQTEKTAQITHAPRWNNKLLHYSFILSYSSICQQHLHNQKINYTDLCCRLLSFSGEDSLLLTEVSGSTSTDTSNTLHGLLVVLANFLVFPGALKHLSNVTSFRYLKTIW